MPLSPEQEILCERLEKGEPDPRAAALIRQQAREIDDLWDRLSRAYALVRQESPAEMIQDEIEQLRAMLDERQQLQMERLSPSSCLARRAAQSSVCGL
jgi:rubrerythrin